MHDDHLQQAVHALRRGGVIAYPTEAVYGLGCDPGNPAAVTRLLAIKQRPTEMGLILIAADFEQLRPYIGELDPATAARVRPTWPGPVTWVLPARSDVPDWLRGAHETIAVRVTDHALAAALCRAFGGALVSTSANRSGDPPLRSAAAVREYFAAQLDFVLDGELGGRMQPSEIRDGATGRVLRPG